MIHTQIEILTDVIKHSIAQKDERVYHRFNWEIHHLIDTVLKLKNLTEYQKQSYFDDVYYKLDALTDYAIKNKVYEDIDIISAIQMEIWIKQGNKKLYEKGLFHYSKLLKRLNGEQKLSSIYIDEFFMIGRVVAGSNINQEEKEDILSYVFDTGVKLFEKRYESERVNTIYNSN